MLNNKSTLILIILLLAANIFAQDFTLIANGIEQAKFTRKIKDEPINVNLLRLDLTKVRLDVVHALDAAVGLETTSSIATRHRAFAAINAGFFKMTGVYNGDAAGILQIDGRLLSESFGGRCALEISNLQDKTEVSMERLNVNGQIIIDKKPFEVGINRQRSEDDAVIYTPFFHRTTLTNPNGTEFIVKKNKIVAISKELGSSEIPADGFVLSASGKRLQELLKLLKIGKKVKLANTIMPTQAEDIVGGVPQLIKNGKIEITWEQEKIGKEFVETRHPRTAVAKLKDGKFLMVTVDGRQPNVSVGMNLQELAEMLLEFGAVDAMNLDGGGSTTMFIKDKVVNQVSDKTGERPVSDAILVTLRK
jgi:exopolysaccharide biosynthesis protein